MDQPPRNLVELAKRSCERYADKPLFGTKRDGEWVWTTHREFGERVDRCRAGLHALGVGPGDRVAIVSNNRVEWAVACHATYGLEATFVPMYEAQRPDEWRFILEDSGAKVAFARAGGPYEALRALRGELPKLERVIGIDLPRGDPDSFEALLEAGARAPFAARDPEPDVTAGFIYTSGTTGKPKGVILSHGNIVSNVAVHADLLPIGSDDVALSFLPWAHSYGNLELQYGILQGGALALNDRIESLLSNLVEVKPTILVTVPRVFNRVYEVVQKDIAERPALLQRLFADGIHASVRRRRGERVGPLERLELTVDDRLIFRKIRDRFGGRLRMVLCGAAALGKEVAEFVDALGIDVYEGYGLTETSPVVTGNRPGARRIGSVGKPIPGVRVEIDTSVSTVEGQGEIVVYGPNVMKGYHDRPEENEKAFTPDGGFRTGDLGYLDEDGFLYITGRIKEQYKLSNGKYVMPGPLEEELKISPYVANVMLHGANEPYNVALVVLDVPAVRAWAEKHGFELGDPTRDPRVEALIMGELHRYARSFRGFEVPRRAVLVADDFTIEDDLLTPTLKLKRRNVEARYGAAIAALYKEREPPSVHA